MICNWFAGKRCRSFQVREITIDVIDDFDRVCSNLISPEDVTRVKLGFDRVVEICMTLIDKKKTYVRICGDSEALFMG